MAAAFQLILEAEEDNERPRLNKPRVFRDRLNPVDGFSDEDLITKYRLSRQCILTLLETIAPDLERTTNRSHPIQPIVQLTTALRFLATGSFQRECGDIHGLSKASVSRCIETVSGAIARRVGQYISFPTGDEEFRKIKQGFFDLNGFPNVIGVIDGTIIAIKAPSEDEPIYICRKHYHAINVQLVCDAHLRLLHIVAKWPGCTHDSYMLSKSELPAILDTSADRGWLLGDSGYPLKPWLFTPLTNPRNRGEQKYNDCHSKTRAVVERCNGVWKSRFRCIDRSGGALQYKPKKSCQIIISTTCLHQICVVNGLPLPSDSDEETNGNAMQENGASNNDYIGEEGVDGRSARQRLIERKFSR